MTLTDLKLKKGWPKDAVMLIPELIWVIIAFIPMILWAGVQKITPYRKRLKGEIVLITGAGNGLGRELAFRMAKKGCKLALADINEDAVRNVASDINQKHENAAKSYVANVGKPRDIKILHEKIMSDFGRVDVLINNVGLVYLGRPFLSLKDEEIDAVFQVNVVSQFRIIREFLDGMVKRNHGHIVAISSTAAYVGVSNGTLYTSTKWALNGMMESLRAELGMIPNNRIKLSTVCPYFIDTSPVYAELLDIRIPALSVDEAAEAVIDGIETETFEFTIPSNMSMLLNLLKLFPENLKDMFISVFYFRIRTRPEENLEHLQHTKIIETLNQGGKS